MSAAAGEPSADDYALVAKPAPETEAPDLPYRPPMPRDRSMAIALVGAGGISGAHLDAYKRHELNVVAICSRDLARAEGLRDAYSIARHDRKELYALRYHKPARLVPRRDVV